MTLEEKIRENERYGDREKETAIEIAKLLDGFTVEEVQDTLGLVYNNFSLNCTFTFSSTK